MVNFLQWLSAAAALLAAAFWMWSALMHIPDTAKMRPRGPESPSGYMQKQSRLSAVAAAFADVSAIAQATSMLIPHPC